MQLIISLTKKPLPVIILSTVAAALVSAQSLTPNVALKSTEEDYYDFLALQGLAERPYLNYRTLSDNAYKLKPGAADMPWAGLNLGTRRSVIGKPQSSDKKEAFNSLSAQIYGPNLFMSVNTNAPYGQNDGALWQGRGFNASLDGGVRFEGWGAEAMFKPQLAFSQNASFGYMAPSSEMQGVRSNGKTTWDFTNKASKYGYFWGVVDAPQRFGNKPFFTWDWGDSEVRWSPLTLISQFTSWSGWDGFDKNFTIGFGTQAVWLGPGFESSILSSNNAPTYPKFDIGLRKQRVSLPWFHGKSIDLGDLEARCWVGQLHESKYFDNDSSNDKRMFSGMAIAYAPPFQRNFNIFFNYTSITPWETKSMRYLMPIPYFNADYLGDVAYEDKRFSVGGSWTFTSIGFEIYAETGWDDYIAGGITGFLRDFSWTNVWMMGLKKTVTLSKTKNIHGELRLEISTFDDSKGRYGGNEKYKYYSFYRHSSALWGYTNRGQWLGNAVSPGGNYQYLDFTVYYPKGKTTIAITRNNPDSDYAYAYTYGSWDNNSNFIISAQTSYYLNAVWLSGGLAFDLVRKYNAPTYKYNYNVSLQFGVKYNF
jgi:hypothetical protein